MTSALVRLLFLLLALCSNTAAVASATHLRAKGAFTCSLSAFDEDSCDQTKDDDGTPCVWCTLQGAGVCVSHDQSESLENLVPQIECSSSKDDDSVTPDTDDHISPNDDALPDDFWDCLATTEERDCECTWCTTSGGYGMCLSKAAAKEAKSNPWFDCSTSMEVDTLKSSSPLDPTCLAAGMGSDDAQSVCDATVDENGSPCVWCDAAGVFGLCLSTEGAEAAKQYLQCDSNDDEAFTYEVEEEEEAASPMDTTCLQAGLQGTDACHDAQDEDGNDCVWCLAGSTGVCLSSDQAEMAGQWLTCESMENPLDPVCWAAGLNGDDSQDVCATTKDESGAPCVWCDAGGVFGLCLSTEVAETAKSYLQCDAMDDEVVYYEDFEDEFDDEVYIDEDLGASPMDPTCLKAGFQGGNAEESCQEAQDADGQPCVWCQGPTGDNMGICLSTDQAQMAKQWLTCDSDAVVDVQIG